jgi:serine/threonine-protein kinase
MEYVDGLPIDVYCRNGNLPIKATLELILQVARAVAHAHGRLVVHRDLKPGNILVTAAGSVRLLDFGIAKLLETDTARETRLTQMAGRALTPEYASPEQVKGEVIGTATDVYSLAIVACELLTGKGPTN